MQGMVKATRTWLRTSASLTNVMILLAVVIPLWRCAVVAGEDALLDAPTPPVATFNGAHPI